jgi:hypothetical protein
MDEEAIYEFDTCGWVLLRNILSADEVRSASSAAASRGAGSDSSSLLDDHPTLQAAKLALIGPLSTRAGPGEAYKLDVPPSLLTPPASAALRGGRFDAEGREIRSRSYVVQAGHRRCHGLRIVWALSDAQPSAGTVHVISGSHRSSLPAPTAVLSGADTMGLLRRVEMRAGDLLLLSSALLFGVRPLAPQPMQQLLGLNLILRQPSPAHLHQPVRQVDHRLEHHLIFTLG